MDQNQYNFWMGVIYLITLFGGWIVVAIVAMAATEFLFGGRGWEGVKSLFRDLR